MMSILNRRELMALTGAALATTASAAQTSTGKEGFSIALGGGAALGIAHLPVLEVIDELGVKPNMVAGTSMGAILGACYASGMSAQAIAEHVVDLFESRLATLQRMFPQKVSDWGSLFSFSKSAMLEAEILMTAVIPEQVPDDFEALEIPLRIVTTDYYRQSEFVIESGPLRKAIGASAALPVFLEPVDWQGRVLIDGGFVNPTPFDLLADQAGSVVAVDVTGNGIQVGDSIPSALDTWMGSSQIALHSLVNERLKRIVPDLLIRPDVRPFGSMEFHRAEEILTMGRGEKDQIKHRLETLLDLG